MGSSEVEQLLHELENQLRHLDRSTTELQAIVDAGLDEAGAPLTESDRKVYTDTIAENKSARLSKEARVSELRSLVQQCQL